MSQRKSWPNIAEDEYHQLISISLVLEKYAKLLFEPAVFGPRNTSLFQQLMILIPASLDDFRHEAIKANAKRQNQRRWPSWVIAALEDGIALASDLQGGINMINDAYLKRNWDLVERLAPEIKGDLLKFHQFMIGGPEPKPDNDDPWADLDSILDSFNSYWDNKDK